MMATPIEAIAAELALATSKAPTKVVVGKSAAKVHTGIPDDIQNNLEIDTAMRALPANYSFEVKKTIWKIRQAGAKRVALQMPEGLLLYACTLCDILSRFTGAETLIMGDVTYGACCIDDFSAAALGCDMLVHYGHSCLVPIDVTTGVSAPSRPSMEGGAAPAPMKVLYVFVEITFDHSHLVETIRTHWPLSPSAAQPKLALMGTIQFASVLHTAKAALESAGYTALYVPQAKPLSPGETLGCTAPKLGSLQPVPPAAGPGGVWDSGQTCTEGGYSALLFVADGRFHLEAALIANPTLASTGRCYRYDPYSKRMSSEGYDHRAMSEDRREAVSAAAQAGRWGIILGTLGRQGSPAVLQRLQEAARAAGKSTFVLALSEVKPHSLARFPPPGHAGGVGAWVQVACPRLSIDWGRGFSDTLAAAQSALAVESGGSSAPVPPIPLLNPYEAHVALGLSQPWWHAQAALPQYLMDYYSREAGPWGNYYKAGPLQGGDGRRAVQAKGSIVKDAVAPVDTTAQAQ